MNVYTDGSHIKRDGYEYCGYGILFPNKELNNVSSVVPGKIWTNQRAELYAIYKAIKLVVSSKLIAPKNKKNAKKTTKKYKYDKLNIYTDSQYSINCVTKWITDWKINLWLTSKNQPVLHSDIIRQIDKYISKYNIVFTHIMSHTNKKDIHSINNNIVDKLAKCGALNIKMDDC